MADDELRRYMDASAAEQRRRAERIGRFLDSVAEQIVEMTARDLAAKLAGRGLPPDPER